MADTRFPTALQIVVTAAINERQGVRTTSSTLADSLETNSSFVRKTLSTMAKAGIISASEGAQGGIKLAKPANQITLQMVRDATTPDARAWAQRDVSQPACLVTRNIGGLSEMLCSKADDAIAGVLSSMTIEDCLNELHRLDTSR
ncbi:RrF2 family transcriptional regulator [Rhizobium sp. Rhizsp82]|uniref:RrF2 family transcriptional regulator n=1 Tax=Rhizobium sp. Rhizsp82 TaxID=3243057 RepID=UPI0039B6E981